ncbi:MAG: type II toxin-antitoxin system VapC family toxin [Alphaproteobacteria bacterium]|nr:MAG: type II toxin-antitoxin system VapC family toxin [Alphaproteobacteria bacterium]
MIVLDTNVVSDSYRARPHPSVRNWLIAQPSADLFICAPVLAELSYGVECLPPGERRRDLADWVRKIEKEVFAGRILPFDADAAHEFGKVFHRRKSIGRPIGIMDAIIAAVAKTNGAVVATRDTDDFADLGLRLVNPFEFTGA